MVDPLGAAVRRCRAPNQRYQHDATDRQADGPTYGRLFP